MQQDEFFANMFAPLKLVFRFQGRSTRGQFWPYALLIVAAYIVTFTALMTLTMGSANGFFTLLELYFPLIFLIYFLLAAATVRRLHDVGWSGWWLTAHAAFVVLNCAMMIWALTELGSGSNPASIPNSFLLFTMINMIGSAYGLFLIVLCVLDGTPGANRFGSDPKGRTPREQKKGERPLGHSPSCDP